MSPEAIVESANSFMDSFLGEVGLKPASKVYLDAYNNAHLPAHGQGAHLDNRAPKSNDPPYKLGFWDRPDFWSTPGPPNGMRNTTLDEFYKSLRAQANRKQEPRRDRKR